MKGLIFRVAVVGLLGFMSLGYALAADYSRFVVVQSAAVRDIGGQIRFCPSQNLRNGVCGTEGRLLGMGKQRFMPMDWFTPESYVSAVTGMPEGSFDVTDVTLSPYGQGLVIYYR